MKTRSALFIIFTILSGPALAAETGGAGFWGLALQSFFILTREGVEAILIITALIAWLQRAGAADKTRIIYQGAGWAVAASLATAYLLQSVLQSSGEMREALEGASMVLAAVVLFYVSFWLIARAQAGKWQSYIRDHVNKAVTTNSMLALGFAAFLAVYREGAETVLFYQALVTDAPSQISAIGAGFIAAALGLAIIYAVMHSATRQLPLGLFFSVTAGLLMGLAFIYAGKGVHELQDAHLISETMIAGLPKIRWLGLYPTIETLSAQMLVFIPALVMFVRIFGNSLRRVALKDLFRT